MHSYRHHGAKVRDLGEDAPVVIWDDQNRIAQAAKQVALDDGEVEIRVTLGIAAALDPQIVPPGGFDPGALRFGGLEVAIDPDERARVGMDQASADQFIAQISDACRDNEEKAFAEEQAELLRAALARLMRVIGQEGERPQHENLQMFFDDAAESQDADAFWWGQMHSGYGVQIFDLTAIREDRLHEAVARVLSEAVVWLDIGEGTGRDAGASLSLWCDEEGRNAVISVEYAKQVAEGLAAESLTPLLWCRLNLGEGDEDYRKAVADLFEDAKNALEAHLSGEDVHVPEEMPTLQI
ncbi:hypothetical protein CKO28_17495 [Rhodovibrio sodomensis]|uniref:Uncharacterized protein n=2 Tax=Rhodovibrio sodomensis TaxID=1088 RepID=A0ABS1DJD2_9PROT|nr:hypothetical protein [Rhodovibrio sodomensis]